MDNERTNTNVSIHTPTKGVTIYADRYRRALIVSIHTPTKGVTVISRKYVGFSHVSIHTPTKGVTQLTQGFDTLLCSFNPHTHEGCDCIVIALVLHFRCFNPHTHEGCDCIFSK